MTEKMKPSAIAWIGNIPESWDIGRVKDYYTLQTGFTPDTSVSEYYDNENGYLWASIADIDKDKHIYDTKSKVSDLYVREKHPASSPEGSLLYSFKLSVGKVAFLGKEMFTNEAIASFANSPNICLAFLYYSSMFIEENANRNIYGAKILNQDLIKNAHIVFPPLIEQCAIADYLDTQCAKIDSVIADIEKQIETLQKYKKSLITETVTKGLDRAVPMKDSGIEWIGEIPKHWGINKTRYLANLCSGATPSKDVYSYWEGDIPWVSSQEVKTDIIADTSLHISEEAIRSCSTKLMPPGTLVMVVRSGILQHTIPVALLGVPATINQDIKAFVFKPEMISAFYKYYIQGENDALLNVLIKDKTTVESIDNNLLLSLRIMVPPVQEQKDIVSYLDERCNEIDTIVTDKQAQLDVIIQHKKSLIYEYVTGKKRVTEVN